MSFNPLEIAVVNVAGVKYQTWTRIEAEREFPGIWSHVTFDAIEPSTMKGGRALPISAMQIMPGSLATVSLGGQLAVTGEVDIRSVDYAMNAHNIKIRIASMTKVAMNQSVRVAPGEYRKQTLSQIAGAVLSPINLKAIIGPGATKIFPVVREAPGESVIEFLERLVRHRGMMITDNANGDLLFDNFQTTGGPSATFVEGGNIIRAHLHIQSTYGTVQMAVKGQSTGGSTPAIAGVLSSGPQVIGGGVNILPNSTPFRYIVAEMPVDPDDLRMRLGHQVNLDAMQLLEATLTVSGWFAPSGVLWINCVTSPPTAATLQSPMLIPADMKGFHLYIKRVRSYQSNEEGTMTDVTLSILPNLTGEPFITPPADAPAPVTTPPSSGGIGHA